MPALISCLVFALPCPWGLPCVLDSWLNQLLSLDPSCPLLRYLGAVSPSQRLFQRKEGVSTMFKAVNLKVTISKLVSSIEAMFSPFSLLVFTIFSKNYKTAVENSKVNEDETGVLKHLSIFSIESNVWVIIKLHKTIEYHQTWELIFCTWVLLRFSSGDIVL